MDNKQKIDYIYRYFKLINKEDPDNFVTTSNKLNYIVIYIEKIRDMYKKGDNSGGHGFK